MIRQIVDKIKLKRGRLKTNYFDQTTQQIRWDLINPEEGEMIFDLDEKKLYIGDGTGSQVEIKSGGEGNQIVSIDTVPPDSPTEGMMWIDTSSTPYILRTWNGTQWVVTGGGLDRQLQDTLYQSIDHRHDNDYQQIQHTHDYTDIDFTNQKSFEVQSDIPDYTQYDFKNKFLKVTNQGDGLEWQQISLTLNDLQDSPQYDIYQQGNEGKIIRIRNDLLGWELVDIQNLDIPQLDQKQDDLLIYFNKDPNKLLTSDQFDIPLGIPQLDNQGKIKYDQIPDSLKSITVVETIQERDQLIDVVEGTRIYVIETGKEYIYDQDTQTWEELPSQTNVILNWDNIIGKPVSSPSNIDDQVNKKHEHSNLNVLEQTELPFTQQIYDSINQKLDKTEQQNTYLRINDPIYLKNLSDVNILNTLQNNEQLVYQNGYFVNKKVILDSELNNITVGYQNEQNNQLQLDGQPQSYYQKQFIIQSSEPTTVYQNDIWLDTTDPNNYELKIRIGSEWKKVSGGLSSSDIDNVTLHFNQNGLLSVVDNSHLHTKQNITDFEHTHFKQDIIDFSHNHTKSDIIDFPHTHTKSEITDFSHTHNPTDIITDENHRFVTDTQINYWDNKQNKDGTLQINLNQEMLNGQKLDNSIQSSSQIWDSLKTKTYVDQFVQGVSYLQPVIDIIDDPTTITPQQNDRYIVGVGQINDFSGHDNEIQTYDGSTWNFYIPQSGEQVSVENLNKIYYFNGSEWIYIFTIVSHNTLGGLQGGNGVDEYYHLDHETYVKLTTGFTTDDISEGTNNKYFTEDRQKQVIQNFITQTSPLQFDSITGEISITQQSPTSDGYMSHEQQDKLDKIDISGTLNDNDQLLWDSQQGKFTPKKVLSTLTQVLPLQFDTQTNTLSILKQTESEDGIMSKEDKQKVNRLFVNPSDIISQLNNYTGQGQLVLQLDNDPTFGQVLKLKPIDVKTTFIELTDTPSTYEDGKFLKVNVDHLEYTTINWDDIQGKPTSTVEDIDDQVSKRHEHQNLSTLDTLTQQFVDDLTNKTNIQYNFVNNWNSIIIPDSKIQWNTYTPVTQQEKNTWNQKQDQLGYTPENKQEKGQPNGYTPLGSDGKIPDIYLPDKLKTVKVVQTFSDLSTISDPEEGMRVFVQDQYDDPNVNVHESREYIYNHDTQEWVMVNPSTQFELTWDNLIGKPTSLPSDIDDQVNKRHEHTSSLQDIEDQVSKRHEHQNKSVLDQIPLITSYDRNKVLFINSSGNVIWDVRRVGTKEVDETNIQNNRTLVFDSSLNKLVYKDYISKWEELDKTNQKIYDLPDVDDYTGQYNKFLVVNETGDGITYTEVIDGGTW